MGLRIIRKKSSVKSLKLLSLVSFNYGLDVFPSSSGHLPEEKVGINRNRNGNKIHWGEASISDHSSRSWAHTCPPSPGSPPGHCHVDALWGLTWPGASGTHVLVPRGRTAARNVTTTTLMSSSEPWVSRGNMVRKTCTPGGCDEDKLC